MQVSRPVFAFSALFSADVVGASFDNAIHADAANGRVNAAFTGALVAAYGVAIPASPAQAVRTINEWVTQPKAPAIAKGHGARSAAPMVAQALHALGSALHAAGKAKGLPMLADLAAWADPVKVAAASAKRSADAKARAADKPKPVAAVVAPTLAAEQAVAAPKASAAELRAQAVNLVLSAASAGALSQVQIDALRAALAIAQPAASKSGKGRKNPAPVALVAPDVVAADVVAVAASASRGHRKATSKAAAMVLESMARDAALLAQQRGATVDVPVVTH